MPCMWCLPSTTLPFYTIKVRVSSPPLAGHHVEGMDGTSITDHVLCVVHLAASPYDDISSTAMMVCCPLSGGTRVDQHRGHAESVIGKDKYERHQLFCQRGFKIQRQP